jgi:hypothetical protein
MNAEQIEQVRAGYIKGVCARIEHEGYVAPEFTVIGHDGGSASVGCFNMNPQGNETLAVVYQIAVMMDAQVVLFVQEAWYATRPPDSPPVASVRDLPDRKEAVVMVAAIMTPDGNIETVHWQREFTRDGETVHLGEEITHANPSGRIYERIATVFPAARPSKAERDKAAVLLERLRVVSRQRVTVH